MLREFDLVRKRFVPPSEGGFVVPEAKTRVAWQSADVLLIGTQFPGDDAAASLTDSGYPRTIREWRRGTPLEEVALTPNPNPNPDPNPSPNPSPTPSPSPNPDPNLNPNPSQAVEVFAGEATDVSVSGHVSRHQGVEFEWRRRALSFYPSEQHVRRRNADGTPAYLKT